MKKKVFSFLLMALAIVVGSLSGYAQQMPQLTPLPEMPGMRTGKLPNGLTYYVLSNKKPEGKANFYIAQKVGSTLETKDQLGLAHFLEHMAFNGTTTYPGKTMLTYLQNKGLRFGNDINAYTSFDETVYNIDNVPTSDKNLMDSVLLVLRDWSCNLLLEDDEIENERGVIQEEWRSRNDVKTRRSTSMLKSLFEEYQYQQMPIGTMDVVMNFKPDVLRDYYHKWYRPDQQGIVIVGDFDAEEMEKKVIDLFTPIVMPDNVPERTYAEVSDNKELIYFEFEDPEWTSNMVQVMFKSDPVPFEMRNTAEMYINVNLMQMVLSQLLNNRLSEYSHEPACKYASAFVRFEPYVVASTKEAFTTYIFPKDNLVEGYQDAMAVVARACKTGFTPSELERVDSEILSLYEQMNNEKDKTTNESLGTEIIRHFIDNQPAPGIEHEYELVSMVLPQIPVEMINQLAGMLLTPENQVITVTETKTADNKLPGKATMQNILNEVLAADYEPYVDEVITEPLLKNAPVAGKIVSENPGKFDTTEFMLSNGVKVVVKPTDFANDEICLEAWCEGGKKSYPVAQAANIQMIENAYDASRLGNFDNKTLRKYLAGKQLSLGLSLGMEVFNFTGQSTVKDLPTLMELFYASMTELSEDQQQYDLDKENMLRRFEKLQTNPDFIFAQHQTDIQWNNNPLMAVPSVEDIKAANYSEMVSMIKAATANAADYTLVFVGNVDMATLRPLLEQYVASLPSTGKKNEVNVVTEISMPTNNPVDDFTITAQSPIVKLFGGWDGNNLPYNVENNYQVRLLGSILSNVFTNTIREEMGASYSPGAAGMMYPQTGQWTVLYVIETNAEVCDAAYDRAVKEFKNLVENGADPEMFNQVRGAALNQLEITLHQNEYWSNQLMTLERGKDMITGAQEFLKNLTIDQFNAFIKANCNSDSTYTLKMNAVTAE